MAYLSGGGGSPGGRRLRLGQLNAVSVACQSAEGFEAQSLDLVLRSLRELLDANPFKQLVVGLSGMSILNQLQWLSNYGQHSGGVVEPAYRIGTQQCVVPVPPRIAT